MFTQYHRIVRCEAGEVVDSKYGTRPTAMDLFLDWPKWFEVGMEMGSEE